MVFKFEFAVIYGRRRVGKTAIINEFTKGKPANDQVLAYKAPLYGRRTAQFKVQPFEFQFEEICKQYLWTLLLTGKCAIDFTDIGRWWGTNSKTKQQVEIDIMGTADKNTALFGECKWTNEKILQDIRTFSFYRHR